MDYYNTVFVCFLFCFIFTLTEVFFASWKHFWGFGSDTPTIFQRSFLISVHCRLYNFFYHPAKPHQATVINGWPALNGPQFRNRQLVFQYLHAKKTSLRVQQPRLLPRKIKKPFGRDWRAVDCSDGWGRASHQSSRPISAISRARVQFRPLFSPPFIHINTAWTKIYTATYCASESEEEWAPLLQLLSDFTSVMDCEATREETKVSCETKLLLHKRILQIEQTNKQTNKSVCWCVSACTRRGWSWCIC